MPINDDGSGSPPFERKDLDMSNPVDREIMSSLHRARSEGLSRRAYYNALKRAGQEMENLQFRGKPRTRSR